MARVLKCVRNRYVQLASRQIPRPSVRLKNLTLSEVEWFDLHLQALNVPLSVVWDGRALDPVVDFVEPGGISIRWAFRSSTSAQQ